MAALGEPHTPLQFQARLGVSSG